MWFYNQTINEKENKEFKKNTYAYLQKIINSQNEKINQLESKIKIIAENQSWFYDNKRIVDKLETIKSQTNESNLLKKLHKKTLIVFNGTKKTSYKTYYENGNLYITENYITVSNGLIINQEIKYNDLQNYFIEIIDKPYSTYVKASDYVLNN